MAKFGEIAQNIKFFKLTNFKFGESHIQKSMISIHAAVVYWSNITINPDVA